MAIASALQRLIQNHLTAGNEGNDLMVYFDEIIDKCTTMIQGVNVGSRYSAALFYNYIFNTTYVFSGNNMYFIKNNFITQFFEEDGLLYVLYKLRMDEPYKGNNVIVLNCGEEDMNRYSDEMWTLFEHISNNITQIDTCLTYGDLEHYIELFECITYFGARNDLIQFIDRNVSKLMKNLNTSLNEVSQLTVQKRIGILACFCKQRVLLIENNDLLKKNEIRVSELFNESFILTDLLGLKMYNECENETASIARAILYKFGKMVAQFAQFNSQLPVTSNAKILTPMIFGYIFSYIQSSDVNISSKLNQFFDLHNDHNDDNDELSQTSPLINLVLYFDEKEIKTNNKYKTCCRLILSYALAKYVELDDNSDNLIPRLNITLDAIFAKFGDEACKLKTLNIIKNMQKDNKLGNRPMIRSYQRYLISSYVNKTLSNENSFQVVQKDQHMLENSETVIESLDNKSLMSKQIHLGFCDKFSIDWGNILFSKMNCWCGGEGSAASSYTGPGHQKRKQHPYIDLWDWVDDEEAVTFDDVDDGMHNTDARDHDEEMTFDNISTKDYNKLAEINNELGINLGVDVVHGC